MIDSKSKHIQDDGVNITILRSPNYTGKAIVSKIGKTNADYSVQNKRMINCLLESNIATGEIVQIGSESLLTVVSRQEVIQGTPVSLIAHGLICNTTLTVTRKTETYDDYGNVTGETTETIVNAAPCRADTINARMRQEDPGLLSTTILKVFAADNANIKLLDKATVAGEDYQLNDIDRFQIPGAMVLQFSTWTAG